MPLIDFHPAVAAWFGKQFSEPTEPQAKAWPAIRSGRHTLIAAPTGSGKTLAAFLSAIDDLVRQSVQGTLQDATQVVYVSPLKALSNDIQRNLQVPLEGVRRELESLGITAQEIRTLVRTGDTPASERTRMTKRPPHVIVTTPESLYILLTSEGGRRMLRTARTLIVDEIHAIVGTKRGAHMALSMERLEALVGSPLVRIGLSATQRPIEEVARFLVGTSNVRVAGEKVEGAAPVRQGVSSRQPAQPLEMTATTKPERQAGSLPYMADADKDLDQRPAEKGIPDCTIIDTGHVRRLDLAIEVPRSPLEPVMSGEVWEEVYDRLAELIIEHRSTLVFVNTRRMAERVCRHLGERVGTENITSHHGSLAKEKRLNAEQRLKNGDLRALVATASLELGIDIGAVDLVCQIGSTRSIATLLQRVGRASHQVGGTPKGRLFPTSRDELVECAALLDSVRRGELDQLSIPELPLDILAQQIVATVATGEWTEDNLYELVRRAYPYRGLSRADFDSIISMLSEGFTTRRGRRSAYLHRDAVNRRLRGRRGAGLAAITSGGAIPDTADYQVILQPGETPIGTVNEDFAIESMQGDIFQLGNASWRILRVEPGKVRVEDAQGQPPSIPFWLGEAPGRTQELSAAVSRLRTEVSLKLAPHLSTRDTTTGDATTAEEDWFQTSAPRAVGWLENEVGISRPAAEQIVIYLAASQAALGTLPSQTTIIIERFFDETGGTQLVIHSPFGSRLNRAWGLALRKRFCRKFNFELQAAATEDAIVISLSPVHSFPLDDVSRYLRSQTVRDVLTQALLDAPMFAIRWRWSASRALAVLRWSGGRKIPAQLQRIQAEDLLAAVFPDQLACAENLTGEREIPDHPLVRQSIRDCLEEAMDIEALEDLLRQLEAGKIQVLARELTEPSPLAQEILNARPYAFLDDAPLEERRTQAVMSRRWLDPQTASDLGRLDEAAIDRVREESWPQVESPDELHDALLQLGFLQDREGRTGSPDWQQTQPPNSSQTIGAAPQQDERLRQGWSDYLELLAADSRAAVMTPYPGGLALWVAAERLPHLLAIFPEAATSPSISAPDQYKGQEWTFEKALVEVLRGRMEAEGPVTAAELARQLGLGLLDVEAALAGLEAEGFILRGSFTPAAAGTQWCVRRLLSRIHSYTLNRLRKEVEPVAVSDFLRFLFDWQRLSAEHRAEGQESLAGLIEQLEGFESPAAAWEADVLPARMVEYDPAWLDALCLSGRMAWLRLTPPRPSGDGGRSSGPVKNSPISLLRRKSLESWSVFSPATDSTSLNLSHLATDVYEHLVAGGASFFADIVDATGLLRSQVEDALGELVSWGLVTADSFTGLRALLTPSDRRPVSPGVKRRHRTAVFGMESAGRWALTRRALPALATSAAGNSSQASTEPHLEKLAYTLLRRYGVVMRRLLDREGLAPPWRELLRVYRKLEARGEIRGGRFVGGFSGEQFALPEAVGLLRTIRRTPKTGELVSVSAADPLNLLGIMTPGSRVSSLPSNRILFRDGEPIAILEAGRTTFMTELSPSAEWEARNVLIRRRVPPQLRTYLGQLA